MQTVCSVPGCPALAAYRDRCAAHPRRPKTPEWRRARAEAMRRDRGLCVDCGAKATVVHHLEPVVIGGRDLASNMACLCKDCHRKREQ